jgi:hypothetical protein
MKAPMKKPQEFKSHAKRCSHCGDAKKLDNDQLQCGRFGWLIASAVGRRQAVCDDNALAEWGKEWDGGDK